MFFKLAWRHLRGRAWEVAAVIVLQMAATIATLELPSLNARIIDEGVAVGDTGLIGHLGFVMLGIASVQMICTALSVYLGARLAMSLGAYLREQMFTHIHGFGTEDFHEYGASSLITRSTNDVSQIQMTTMMTSVPHGYATSRVGCFQPTRAFHIGHVATEVNKGAQPLRLALPRRAANAQGGRRGRDRGRMMVPDEARNHAHPNHPDAHTANRSAYSTVRFWHVQSD